MKVSNIIGWVGYTVASIYVYNSTLPYWPVGVVAIAVAMLGNYRFGQDRMIEIIREMRKDTTL